MKKFTAIILALLFILITTTLSAQIEWKNLKIIPAHPKPGETIRIEYDWQNGTLRKADAIDIVVLEYFDKAPESREVSMEHAGNKLVGTFTTSPNALVAEVGFAAGESWDNNNGNGYFIPMYDIKGKPLAESKAAMAVLYRNFGNLMELNAKAATANDWFDQAFAAQPSIRIKYLSAYINNWMNYKRGDAGKPHALELLNELENAPRITEKDLISAVRPYEFLQAMDNAKALKEKIRSTYPKGVFVQQERLQSINSEPDLTNREALIEKFVKDFPPQSETEQINVSRLYTGLAARAAEQKNFEKYQSAASKADAAARANLYNFTAWDLAEKGEELTWARTFAKHATEWARMEVVAPSTPKPPSTTHKNWELERRQTFASFADTYAYVLDKANEPADAVLWQTQAVDIMKGENDEMNERFTGYLERTSAPDLRYRLEGFILQGHATGKMKEQFKRLYASEDRSEAGSSAYLANLEKAAKENAKLALSGKMIQLPAPAFSLKSLKGETVSLESLKGKVVVVDFWATWCGPCKASFPGMQEALNKYKNDKDVAFVFVNSWERVPGDQKAKTAGDYITGKSYTFNVLMDLDDSVVNDFGVSGIPTKFIIDKNGDIRFKTVGYGGDPESLVEELSAMIELSKAKL